MSVRILVVSMNYKPELTGIGKYSSEMSEWLVKNGCKVTAITAPPYYPNWKIDDGYVSYLYKREKLCGVDVVRCPIWIPKSVTSFKRIIHLLVFGVTSMPVIIWKSLKMKPDLIFVVEPPFFSLFSSILSSKLSGSPVWLHIQDFEIDAAFELGLLKNNYIKKILFNTEKWLFDKTNIISTISQQMMAKLALKTSHDKQRVLFQNWVNLDVIYPVDKNNLRKSLSISDEKVVFLYSGNMGKKQGLDSIVTAAIELAKKRMDLIFVLCGNGVIRKELEEKSMGCDSLKFIPLQPVEQLNALLNTADVHLLPQRDGADGLVMPSKLTNMLASGKPVIATVNKQSEIAEIISGAGLITEPSDKAGFIKSIELLADSKDLRVKMGEKARQIAESKFNSEEIFKRVFKRYITA